MLSAYGLLPPCMQWTCSFIISLRCTSRIQRELLSASLRRMATWKNGAQHFVWNDCADRTAVVHMTSPAQAVHVVPTGSWHHSAHNDCSAQHFFCCIGHVPFLSQTASGAERVVQVLWAIVHLFFSSTMMIYKTVPIVSPARCQHAVISYKVSSFYLTWILKLF